MISFITSVNFLSRHGAFRSAPDRACSPVRSLFADVPDMFYIRSERVKPRANNVMNLKVVAERL